MQWRGLHRQGMISYGSFAPGCMQAPTLPGPQTTSSHSQVHRAQRPATAKRTAAVARSPLSSFNHSQTGACPHSPPLAPHLPTAVAVVLATGAPSSGSCLSPAQAAHSSAPAT
mgnify:CR=1 FL=1